MVLLSVIKLLELCNPLEEPPWEELKGQRISPEEVLEIKKYSQRKFDEYDPMFPLTRQQHLERIAFLVANGWEDEPIELWFNNKGIYPLLDGSHRLAAAIIRKDEWIAANWYGDREQLRSVLYE